MSPWRRETLAAGVDADGLALLARRDGAWRVAAQVPVADYLAAPQAADTDWTGVVGALLAQPSVGRGRVAVTVDDSLARYWLLQAPRGIASLVELRALAASRFETLFGEPASAWHIEADWRADHAMLAAALPRTLTRALADACAARRWRLESLVPRALRTLDRHARDIGRDAALVVFGAHGQVAMRWQGGVPVWLRQRTDVSADVAQLLSWLETEALRAGHVMPTDVLLAGELPFSVNAAVMPDYRVRMLDSARPMPMIAAGSTGAAAVLAMAAQGMPS
ncbi:MAG: hypothetical protein QM639_16330 [Rhodocyclaceae bacterium]